MNKNISLDQIIDYNDDIFRWIFEPLDLLRNNNLFNFCALFFYRDENNFYKRTLCSDEWCEVIINYVKRSEEYKNYKKLLDYVLSVCKEHISCTREQEKRLRYNETDRRYFCSFIADTKSDLLDDALDFVGFDINCSYDEKSLLYILCKNKDENIRKYLNSDKVILNFMIKLNDFTCGKSISFLSYCVKTFPEIVPQMLENPKLDPNLRDNYFDKTSHPIEYAIRYSPELVEHFLKREDILQAQDEVNFMLHSMCKNRDENIRKYLNSDKINLNFFVEKLENSIYFYTHGKKKSVSSFLSYCVQVFPEIVPQMLENPKLDPNLRMCIEDYTPLAVAINYNHSLVKYFMNRKDVNVNLWDVTYGGLNHVIKRILLMKTSNKVDLLKEIFRSDNISLFSGGYYSAIGLIFFERSSTQVIDAFLERFGTDIFFKNKSLYVDSKRVLFCEPHLLDHIVKNNEIDINSFVVDKNKTFSDFLLGNGKYKNTVKLVLKRDDARLPEISKEIYEKMDDETKMLVDKHKNKIENEISKITKMSTVISSSILNNIMTGCKIEPY